MECFRRDDGSLVIGEIAARPAACNHMDITGQAYDTDMDRAWARAVVDDAFDGPFTRSYAIGCVYLRGIGSGRVLRVTGADRVQELVGRLIIETRLPQPGTPRNDSYEGDGYITVRHPETEVVRAAVKTIIETVRVEYGG
jgi:hypothetical protein